MSLDDLELELRRMPGVLAVGFAETEGLVDRRAPGRPRRRRRLGARGNDARDEAPRAVPPRSRSSAGATVHPGPNETRLRLVEVTTDPAAGELAVHLARGDERAIGRASSAHGLLGVVEATVFAVRTFLPDLTYLPGWARTIETTPDRRFIVVASVTDPEARSHLRGAAEGETPARRGRARDAGHPEPNDQPRAVAPVTRPLDGIRVLDVSDSIGAYCTKLLAGLGADVDQDRVSRGRRAPPAAAVPRRRDRQRGESRVRLLPRRQTRHHPRHRDAPRACPRSKRSGSTADVIVISPSRRRPLAGFDEDTLTVSWAPADAVVCAITPYGLTGPYRHRRATHFVGLRDQRVDAPGRATRRSTASRSPAQQHWDEASAHAAVCILAALQNRAAVGGQTIDISAHEVAVDARLRVRPLRRDGHDAWIAPSVIGYPPTGTWQCKDGPFDVAAHQTRHWTAFLRMLDDPAELSDPSLERRARPPGDLRRSRRDDQPGCSRTATAASSSSSARRPACPARS